MFAHCMAGRPGGVALLAINANQTGVASLDLGTAADRYTLTAATLDDVRVQLNGRGLALGAGDQIPSLTPVRTQKGTLELAPASITFLAVADAGNPSCR